MCTSVWSFLFYVFVPFLAAMENFAKLEMKLKRSFGICSLVCAASSGCVILLQLAVGEEDRVALCTSFFVVLALICVLGCGVLGVGGYKVSWQFACRSS
jgi:hypothetical protein